MVITDTDLISGIKYIGKNLDLKVAQRGVVGVAGRGRQEQTPGKMSLSSLRSSEVLAREREHYRLGLAGAQHSPAASGRGVH